MGMCFFDAAVPGGWYKGYESQVWFGVWLGGMIRGMACAPPRASPYKLSAGA